MLFSATALALFINTVVIKDSEAKPRPTTLTTAHHIYDAYPDSSPPGDSSPSDSAPDPVYDSAPDPFYDSVGDPDSCPIDC